VTATRMTRRQMVRALAAAGLTGPAAVALAQGRAQLSPDVLRGASAVIGRDFDPVRLKTIQTALQRNLDQFQIVRDLAIDDLVEPAPIFTARRR